MSKSPQNISLHNKIDLILSSPHRRTIQTTLFAFSEILARPEVPCLLVPNAQEVSSKPCDKGFPLDVLRDIAIPKLFKDEGLSFGVEKISFELIKEGWNSKKGLYAPNHEAVQARAATLRACLYQLEAQHVVLVTHGAFFYYLTKDGAVENLKNGAAYNNCEFRTFTFTKESTVENAHVVEIGKEKHDVETDSTILVELDAVR
ncbi:d50a25fa-0c2c-42bf-9db9-4e4878ad19de [Sclerotinia trifoliorum]|uniref:D50a25fa-0c2c-42bf-9db9-4e4878ad19de n=1 Tax=Sclerotinia trifoliorum TaxID=28548 RepID=A0A8H2VXP5_9HELO|nr:d50a25fa-0c2c-42bf-9db9-4e4878ad19de [Sclerotinia trifoliorum]